MKKFTKPGTTFDSYTLYLGRDNFEIDIPVLPPYEEEVPGLELNEGQDYVSPYALGSSGFAEEDAESNGLGGPILMLFVSIGIVAAIMFFMPQSGIFKVLAVISFACPLVMPVFAVLVAIADTFVSIFFTTP